MLANVAKERMVNVRLSPVVHEQFKIACDLRGVSMSSLLHQFIVRTIREERDLEPNAFLITGEKLDGKPVPIASKHPIRNVVPGTKRKSRTG